MKYNSSNKPLVCMQTQSTCYKGTKKMTVKGILWHSTGVNNKTIKRYVQPSDNAPDREEMLKIIGVNKNGNDWNHIKREAGLNCWIGTIADGSVATVQTMPWDYKPWGCGSGSRGSCNNGWIQFEICEDDLKSKEYFEAVYKEACEITAYLCDMFNLDPEGTVEYNGVKVPVILCHDDAHELKLGSNHGDVNHWFPKYGKSMATARKDVALLLNGEEQNKPETPKAPTESNGHKIGDKVKLIEDATYASGAPIPQWVKESILYVRDIRINGDIVISTQKTGDVTGITKAIYLIKYEENKAPASNKNDNAVFLLPNAKYANGREIPKSIYELPLIINQIRLNGDAVLINAENNQIIGVVNKQYLTNEKAPKETRVQVTASSLRLREGPGTNYKTIGNLPRYTTIAITEIKNGWGKTEKGWISLEYVKKV